jgi:NADPH:quinone reductase-like Zn-dependent oxidoreductase
VRSVVYERYGEPFEVLHLVEVPEPRTPRGDEVLIRVTKRPIHPGDLIGVRGRYDDSDGVATGGETPGHEGFGFIEALGPDLEGSTHLRPGMRVAFFLLPGAWNERVLVPARRVAPVPDDVPDAVACQMLINSVTALMLLRAIDAA